MDHKGDAGLQYRRGFLKRLAATLCALAAQAQDAAAGKVVYAQCSACHSIDGSNGAGPALKDIAGRLSVQPGDEKFQPGLERQDAGHLPGQPAGHDPGQHHAVFGHWRRPKQRSGRVAIY